MLEVERLLGIRMKALIYKWCRMRNKRIWEPLRQYIKPEKQYLRHHGWHWSENNAPGITVWRLEGGECVHDFDEVALEFLKERLRRRDIIASKNISLKRYIKEQMWRDWNIKHPDALLQSPFWVDLRKPTKTQNDNRYRGNQNYFARKKKIS